MKRGGLYAWEGGKEERRVVEVKKRQGSPWIRAGEDRVKIEKDRKAE